MTPAGGYKAQFDYVELMVEPKDGHWLLTLWDKRHGENVVHEEKFDSAAEAQEAALPLAEHHINVQHNDTLVLQKHLTWQQI